MSTRIVGYRCDSCGDISTDDNTPTGELIPWKCPVCGKETCSKCFSTYAVCTECASTRTSHECLLAANSAGWDFDDSKYMII